VRPNIDRFLPGDLVRTRQFVSLYERCDRTVPSLAYFWGLCIVISDPMPPARSMQERRRTYVLVVAGRLVGWVLATQVEAV
jgi:hypothetical protein